MAENETKAEASAEKAYAVASETASKDSDKAKVPAAKSTKPKPATKAKARAAKTKPVRKPAPKKAVAAKAKPKPAAKTPAKAASIFTKPTYPTKTILKETMMDMNKNLEGVQDMIADAQKKAQAAFEKGTSIAGDYSEFAKGNVEALVESGKILAEGLQDIGTNLVAESRTAFETMSADMKDMAAAKSPTELLQVQSEMVRKNFDSAVAYGSKNTEAMLKLASDVVAPLTSRVNVAVEKASKATA